MKRELALVLFFMLGSGPAGAQSPGKAFFLSLLVPGAGQYYARHQVSGTRFVVLEAGLWGGFAGLKILKGVRRDNFRAYAAAHAGARTRGKDKQFFDDLGFYQSSNQHNQFARLEEGPRAVLYSDAPEFFWEWDKEASRLRYRKLRNSSETANDQAKFVTGFVAINHLIAAIHAARAARAHKKAQEAKQARARPHMALEVDPRRASLGLALRASFY